MNVDKIIFQNIISEYKIFIDISIRGATKEF